MFPHQKAYPPPNFATLISLPKSTSSFQSHNKEPLKASTQIPNIVKTRNSNLEKKYLVNPNPKSYSSSLSISPHTLINPPTARSMIPIDCFKFNSPSNLSKTQDWIVALKSLMLVHQVLVNGHPSFAEEIMYTSQRGMRGFMREREREN